MVLFAHPASSALLYSEVSGPSWLCAPFRPPSNSRGGMVRSRPQGGFLQEVQEGVAPPIHGN